MVRNAILSDFWTSKMATSGLFFKLQKSCASDLNNVRTDCWPTTTWYKFTFGQYTYRQLCWERGNIHCVRPLRRMHTILVVYGHVRYSTSIAKCPSLRALFFSVCLLRVRVVHRHIHYRHIFSVRASIVITHTLCLSCFFGYYLLPYANFLKLTKTYQFMWVYH